MKISRHFTTILVISLLSLITVGIVASALTRQETIGQSIPLQTAISQLNEFLFRGTAKNFPTIFSIINATPALQSAAVAPYEIEYAVEQISLVTTQQSGPNPLGPGSFTPQSGKILITGNETIRPGLGHFSSGSASSNSDGTTRQRLMAKLSFPGLPAIQPITITAEFSQSASRFSSFTSLDTSVISISPNTLTIPQIGEFELFAGEPVYPYNPANLEISIKWKKGANGCAFPSVTAPPKGLTVCESSPASLSVAATGNGNLRYQWRRNGIAIPGATNPTLAFAAVSASDVGTYEALVADDCGPVRSATAFLGVNRPGEYSVLDRLTAASAARNGALGSIIASSGNTLIAKAYVGGYDNVHVFSKVADTWIQEALLKPADTTNAGFFGLDERIAIDNNTIAVAESFSVYIFVRTGATWVQQAKLNVGNSSPNFITSLALQGDTLAFGQSFVNSGQVTTVGRVQVYQRTGQTWNLQATLNPTDVEAYLYFGDDIALSGNSLVVGAANRRGD